MFALHAILKAGLYAQAMLSLFNRSHIIFICATIVLFFLWIIPLFAFGAPVGAETATDGSQGGGGVVAGIFETFSHGLSFVLAHIAILGLQWGIFIMAVFLAIDGYQEAKKMN